MGYRMTQNQVIARERGNHQGRAPLRLRDVREGKVEDDNIASYKLAQAASSSGVSQSFAREDSAAAAGMAASAWASARDRKNAISLSRSCSGRRSSSWAMNSRLLMPSLIFIVRHPCPTSLGCCCPPCYI